MIETPLTQEQQISLAVDCWFITGATASGKTLVSLELAKRLDAEIISLDSMAIYRGMDVGTAKPTAAQRALLPHHLIDILEPTESFSVTQYRDRAVAAVQDIRSRDKQVVFVGGTALYLKGLLRGIFEGPPADWEFRKQIEQEAEAVGWEQLHKRLELVDPVSAHKLHPNDKRRIIRALEVNRLTGQPISHLQNEFETGHSPDQCKVFTLRHQRERLHQRIQARVNLMFENDLVGEVQRLLDCHGQLSHTAAQAVGYREVIAYLDGQADLESTRDQVLYRTRQFARHQETWFRGLSECRMLDLPTEFGEAEDDAARLASQIIAAAGSS